MARRKTGGLAPREGRGAAAPRTLKVRAVGNSLGTVWPRELLAKLGAAEGDELHLVDSPLGFVILRNSARLAETDRIAASILERDHDALAALSKR